MEKEIPIENDPFTEEWIRWIRENLSLAVPRERMREAMCNRGVEASTAEVMIRTVEASSEAGERSPERKMRWILESLAKLDGLRSDEIAFCSEIGGEEFYESYYSRNEPVLVAWRERECLAGPLSWHALAENFGDRTVEVQAGRSGDPQYERNSDFHKQDVRFRDFLRDVTKEDENNETYLTANNGKRNREVFSSILDSSDWMPSLLDGHDGKEKAFLWIGPKGTVTQLHHDLTNNLLLQVTGDKLVYLFPPCYFSKIYNDFHCYSDFDCEFPDFERFPLAQDINIRKCRLREGQALFLPVGWWHQIRALSPSISITAVNFKRPNDFARDYDTYHSIG